MHSTPLVTLSARNVDIKNNNIKKERKNKVYFINVDCSDPFSPLVTFKEVTLCINCHFLFC